MNRLAERILMNVPSIILVADHDNKIIFSNTAFGKLIEKRSHDSIGKSIGEVLCSLEGQWKFLADEFSKSLNESSREKHQDSRKQQLTNNYDRDPLIAQSAKNLEFNPPSVITLKDQFFTYKIFKAGDTSVENQNKGLILNNITEEKNFLDRMTQAESISSLKTLAAGISHEISNPLHSILSFSEAIVDEGNLEKIKLYAGKVADNSSRLGKVISDFSGYVQRKNNGIKREVNINECIEAAIKFALLPYPDHKIELEEEIEEVPDLMADPEEIHQIIFNIVNNAIQAMQEAGHLKISTRIVKGLVAIKIQDNGPGMPTDILRKVFNPFFTTKMQGEGTGLGLSITHRLVEKYGGKIEISSVEGEGTEVSLYFPTPSTLPVR